MMKYYVSYLEFTKAHKNGGGAMIVEASSPIDSMEEIEHVAKYIETARSVKNVIVTGAIRLYGDEEVEK